MLARDIRPQRICAVAGRTVTGGAGQGLVFTGLGIAINQAVCLNLSGYKHRSCEHKKRSESVFHIP